MGRRRGVRQRTAAQRVRFAARRAVHLTVSLAWSVLWSFLLQYGERQILITFMHYDLIATFVVL